MREELANALAGGRGVTAKIRWLSGRGDEEGRSRWIHCTPLLAENGSVGVWMVVLCEDEATLEAAGKRRFRTAPPVANNIRPRNITNQGTPDPQRFPQQQQQRQTPNRQYSQQAPSVAETESGSVNLYANSDRGNQDNYSDVETPHAEPTFDEAQLGVPMSNASKTRIGGTNYSIGNSSSQTDLTHRQKADRPGMMDRPKSAHSNQAKRNGHVVRLDGFPTNGNIGPNHIMRSMAMGQNGGAKRPDSEQSAQTFGSTNTFAL